MVKVPYGKKLMYWTKSCYLLSYTAFNPLILTTITSHYVSRKALHNVQY
jgi:hypothetical protein